MTIMLLIFVGLAGGLAVGSGLVAFLTILGIIPRLIHLTKTYAALRLYEWSLIIGTTTFSLFGLQKMTFKFSPIFVSLSGVFFGLFIGLLAAALFEVLNVIPILTRRIGFSKQTISFLMAITFGKVAGSLFQWLMYYR